MARWAVVGAGIAGLAAAWAIRERGDDVVVFERAHRPGGLLQTFREGGFTVDAAAESVRLTPIVRTLVESVGIGHKLIAGSQVAARRYVARGGRAVPLVPPKEFAPPGHPAPPGEGESVTEYFQRISGEASAEFAEALVTGVYAGDPGLLDAHHALSSVLPGPGSTPSPAYAFQGGMATLVEGLSTGLDIRLRTQVDSLDRGSGYRLKTPEGSFECDHLVIALGPAGLRLLDPQAPDAAEAPVSVLGIGLRAVDVADCEPARGYGLLCPENERRFSLGLLFSSSVFPHVAPEGMCLWRAFVGGVRHPERASLGKDETLERVMGDVRTLLGIEPPTEWATLLRHGRGIPQPVIGHPAILAARTRSEKENPRIALCGLGFEGVGVDQALESGIEAVARAAGLR